MIVLKWISGFVFPGRRGGKASAAHNPPPLNPSISESSGLSPHENSSPAIVSETLPTCGSAGGVLPEVSGEPPNANIPLDPSTGNSGELGPPSRSLGDGKDGKSLNPSVIIRGENNTVYGAVHIARDQINNPIYNFPDTQTSPNLEDLRPLTEAHPSLLRIICGAIAFYEPPSAALLSRVLGLQEDEVRRSIEAIASHLRIQVIVAGKIKFPPAFESSVYRSCPLLITAAHEDIACWCLQRAMSEPRHLKYALSAWAWHVSHANATDELITALRNFSFVLGTVTETQLSDVIHRLKARDFPRAAPLVGQYEDRLRTLEGIPLSER